MLCITKAFVSNTAKIGEKPNIQISVVDYNSVPSKIS